MSGIKRTTLPGRDSTDVKDLVQRTFSPLLNPPGRCLVGNITYLRTKEGFIFLLTKLFQTTKRRINFIENQSYQPIKHRLIDLVLRNKDKNEHRARW